MHILIQDFNEIDYVVKKSDIERVYTTMNKTFVKFKGVNNSSIRINISVNDFYNKYLIK